MFDNLNTRTTRIRSFNPGKSFLFLVCTFFGFIIPQAWGQSSELLDKLNGASAQYSESIECFVEFIPGQVRQEGTAILKLWGRVAKGFHIYSIFPQGEYSPEPTQLILESLNLKVESELRESETVWVRDQTFGERLKVHKNDFSLEREYKMQDSLKPGKYMIKGSLFYQVCDNKICSLPVSKHFSIPLEILDE